MDALKGINRRLKQVAEIVNQAAPVADVNGDCQVGVDLGTADIQTIAVDGRANPVAAFMTWADVVRDGIVVDYTRACTIVRQQLKQLEDCLGQSVTEVVTSFPPGTDARISTNVVEAAGVEVRHVVDEPSSVATLLGIRDGAVVDIGGGTTGTAIVKDGKIIASLDDATGGHHVTLALAGHMGIDPDQAEQHKRQCQDRSVAEIVRPVIEKMADIVRSHIDGYVVPTIYLSGGSCCLPGFLDAFAAELRDRTVVLPQEPLYLTPLAIASYSLDVAPALRVVG